jgi:glycosyltransferase involved in cell wall biosynthesis/peptidoglycan/xylan/chitin deacetylase (PgdA/CDA1 family)
MMRHNPLVTGITIFLNGENFLREAIESVLAQTYDNWELLLVDDGSTDRSTEIALGYAAQHPGKIRYYEHKEHQNRGMSASRNLGLRHAQGEYIAFLDHDDVWLPGKLADQVAILETHPEAGMMYGRTRFWYSWSGKPEDRERDGLTILGTEPDSLVTPPHLVTLFLRDERTIASTCSVLVRRTVAERVGGFDETFRGQYEDMVFWSKVYMETPVFVAGGCWDLYRQHPHNSVSMALQSGQWHPNRPSPVREAFLNWLEQYVTAKEIADPDLRDALSKELWPYRYPERRTASDKLQDVCWDAGLALVRGEDPRALLNSLDKTIDEVPSPQIVAEWLFEAVPLAAVRDHGVWAELWPNLRLSITRFLEELERRAQTPGLARQVGSVLKRLVRNNWSLRFTEGNTAHLVFSPDNPDSVRIAITKAQTPTNYDIQLNQPRIAVKSNSRYIVNFLARADSPRDIAVGFAKAHPPWSNLGLYSQIELTPEWQSFERVFESAEDEDNARIHFDLGASGISVELSSITLRSLSEGRFVAPAVRAAEISAPHNEKQQNAPAIPPGQVDFGSFRRLTPISLDWGFDRGMPIDRYYIEKFLASHAEDIHGRVLEIGDDFYTRKFGGHHVAVSDILHVSEGEPRATIIGDLTCADHIPSDSFDCIILTQTLQLIYDVRAALRTLQRILKPGGVVLATFPGISQTYDSEWGDVWYWSFTGLSARRLFSEVFAAEHVAVEASGNVLSAISFLHGLAVHEITQGELDHHEKGYEVTIAVRAVKPDLAKRPTGAEISSRAVRPTGNTSNAKALVLMYHRVAGGLSDPWSLCVAPERFAQQLEVLRKFTEPIPLRDLVATFRSGDMPARASVLTFDDGYADNFHNAQPLLQSFEIPATFFLTTGAIGSPNEFWWDELDRLLLQPGRLPNLLQLDINGAIQKWELGDAADYSEEHFRRDSRWKAPENPPSSRHALYVALWRLLQPLTENDRRSVLNELLVWAGREAHGRSTHRPLSLDEVTALGQEKLVEIGSHTVTHPVLPELPFEMQRDELRRSKARLEEILGRPVTSFAYPYGSYAAGTVPIVRESGYACACSTNDGVVTRSADWYQLPRVEVQDWDGAEFGRRLSTWFESK